MKKETGIFYGSTTGATEKVAREIAKKLNIDSSHVHNVADVAPSTVGEYTNLIFGTSTWGDGQEQEDWFDFLDGAQQLDLRGKRIALFGLGDETMADTFCNGVGELYRRLKDTGAQFVGTYPANVYDFNRSEAIGEDGQPVGLLLDQMNHSDLTDGRIDGWLLTLQPFGF